MYTSSRIFSESVGLESQKSTGGLTMLVPLLTCSTALSAVLLSVNDAWKAVYIKQVRLVRA